MKKFTAFAALAGMVALTACFAAFAHDMPAGVGTGKPGCAKPEYPPNALRKEQGGIVEAGFLIGPDGAVQDSFVVTSSGVPDLDRATVEGLSRCLFKPKLVDGQPVAFWQNVEYKWEIEPDGYAPPALMLALEKGPPALQYVLSLMYSKGFKVDKDDKASHRWLQAAAERGFGMAQFKLGEAYEKGSGVAQDDAQAASWYRKAADQRNVFAHDKLRFGFGSIAGALKANN